MFVGLVYVAGHLAIGIEMTRRLPMKRLLLMAKGSRRARRRLFVIHVLMMMVGVHVVYTLADSMVKLGKLGKLGKLRTKLLELSASFRDSEKSRSS